MLKLNFSQINNSYLKYIKVIQRAQKMKNNTKMKRIVGIHQV
jgi:hypothetical protein